MRRLLPIAILLALAALAAVALAQVEGAPAARLATTAAAGSFEVTNSREGEPIFTAANIGPGGSAEGTVTIEDTGSAAATLVLRRGDIVDSPGLGGGILSDRLRLDVVDITAPTSPRPVYSGPLAAMPDQPAGEVEPGEARTFRFTATFPDAGAPALQNSVQGASTTVAYAWVAEEATAGPTGAGSPDVPAGVPDVPATIPAHLELTVPKLLRALRGGRLVAWAACNVACRVSVGGRLRAAAAGHHLATRIHFAGRRVVPPRSQRLRIPVPRRMRAWLRHQKAPRHLRATLRFTAMGIDGARSVVRRQVRLRTGRR
ncbi:MAG: hypothetical protein JST59_17755 [Actinobacteria bacterium]|nr:hypothetical protein [Actinomycetota bacterium]